jgi:5-methylcytosine-specific restriction enzyme B
VANITRRRVGELHRALFQVLLDEPAGLHVQEVSRRAEILCPPTAFENEDYPNQPGVRRYPKIQRFSTISSVKAGWLVKEQGIWRLTVRGREAFALYQDADEFQRAADQEYQRWNAERTVSEYEMTEEADDIEAARLEAAHAHHRRAWLCRGANVNGTNVLPRWFAESFCSIQWSELPDIPSGTPKVELAKLVKAFYPESSAVGQGLSVGVLDRFLNAMQLGDLVVTVDGPRVYIGEIVGDATYSGEPLVTRQRPVSWKNSDAPARRSQLSSDAADGLRGQLTVSDLSAHLAEFAELAGIEIDVFTEAPSPDAVIPTPDDAMADELLLPLPWLRDTVDLLNDKRQIVLYGPPGTGKTYLAQAICRELVETAGGEYEVVQFHPSYAYEDFFEGLRPRLQQDGSAGVSFEIVHGPLRRMAARATENPSAPFVLIIDEINRANLAKVFGELYFLLEYRGTSVALQYSDDMFLLPRNLFIIGTMNTADRSIALVDAAMRRRFYFQGLFPTEAPIDGLLTRWLAREGLPSENGDLLAELNARINEPDFAIGPSYLMTKRISQPGGLERIWRTAILPLLAEHYFGEGRDIDREFGLSALRGRVSQGTMAPDLSGGAEPGTAPPT